MITGLKMTDADYFAVDAVSKSLLARMDCPAKSRLPVEPTPAMREGSMIHCNVLEPECFDDRYVVAPEINRRTKAGREEWSEFEKAHAGKEIITPEQREMAMAIHEAVHTHPMASRLLINGNAEMAYFWNDGRTGEPSKCKADYVTDGCIVDLKTCVCASPAEFARSVANFKYHWQAAWYSRGIQCDDFVFIAVEKKAPYVVECYSLDKEAVAIGAAQIDAALDRYRSCKLFDDWHGYTDGSGVTTLALPAWCS